MDDDALRRLDQEAFMAQAETLARLVNSPEWQAWERLVMDYRTSCLEEMARASKDDIQMWQGAVHALGEIIGRPQEITDKAAEIHADQQEEAKNTIIVRRDLEGVGGRLVDEV